MERGFSPKRTGYTELFIKTCRIVPHFPFFRVIIAYYAGKSNEFFAWNCEYFYNSTQKAVLSDGSKITTRGFAPELHLSKMVQAHNLRKRQRRFRRGGVLRFVSPATKKGRPFGRLQDHDTRFCTEFVLVVVSASAKPKKRLRWSRFGVSVRRRLLTLTKKQGHHNVVSLFLAGAVRFELTTRGFGDRCSTN